MRFQLIITCFVRMRAHTRSLTDPTAAQGTPTITMKRNETKTKENDMMKKGMENVFKCWKKRV